MPPPNRRRDVSLVRRHVPIHDLARDHADAFPMRVHHVVAARACPQVHGLLVGEVTTAIARVYNEGIEDRVATFETELRTAAEWAAGLTMPHLRAVHLFLATSVAALTAACGARSGLWPIGAPVEDDGGGTLVPPSDGASDTSLVTQSAQCVLLGGDQTSETWLWDGGSWSQATRCTNPVRDKRLP
jgi:hypothetical protein